MRRTRGRSATKKMKNHAFEMKNKKIKMIKMEKWRSRSVLLFFQSQIKKILY